VRRLAALNTNVMNLLLVAAAAAQLASAQTPADLSQWPVWRQQNRRALTDLAASYQAGDASAEDKAAAAELQGRLIALFDEISARVENSAAAARQTLLTRVRDGQMPPAQGARDIMKVSRLREAHLAYWEGTLIREVIREFAERLEKPAPALPHMVPGPEYVATVRANAVNTKELGAEMDLSQATDVLGAEDGEHRH